MPSFFRRKKPAAAPQPSLNMDEVFKDLQQHMQHGCEDTLQEKVNDYRTKNGFDINHIYYGQTLLTGLDSVQNNNFANTVPVLVAAGADINAVNGSGNTPLSLAATRNNPQLASALVSNGADVNKYRMVDDKHETALHCAVRLENKPMVQILVEGGANVDARTYYDANDDEQHCSILDTAVYTGNVAIAQYLIDEGAAVDAVGSEGWTALHTAMQSGSAEMVGCLLQNGADPTHTIPASDSTALHLAARHGNVDAVNMLLSGHDGNELASARDNTGNTPLHSVVKGWVWADAIPRKTAIITALQHAGADMNAQNEAGNTALHESVIDNKGLAGLLCSQGAGTEITNAAGNRADECGPSYSDDVHYIKQHRAALAANRSVTSLQDVMQSEIREFAGGRR